MLTLSDYTNLVKISNYSWRKDLSTMRDRYRSKQYPLVSIAVGYAFIPFCVFCKYTATLILRRFWKKLAKSDRY